MNKVEQSSENVKKETIKNEKRKVKHRPTDKEDIPKILDWDI